MEMLDLCTPHETAASPGWLAEMFAHLEKPDCSVIEELWRDETALRTLILLLNTRHPDHHRLRGCPYCSNRFLKWKSAGTDESVRGHCAACRKSFSITAGTPFFRIHRANYPALYRTAFLLWAHWTPFFAWEIAGCTDTKQFLDFRKRLEPLLDELIDSPLTSRPAYRLGFTPAQQGVLCLRCSKNNLVYRKRAKPENPKFECLDCQYHFELLATRRHLLPLPAGLVCPHCDGDQINRKCVDLKGRGRYQCRDCRRYFTKLG